MFKEFNTCELCPRSCRVNRNAGESGYCGRDAGPNIASVCLHTGEEPPINGMNGICNIFFSGCNLHCIFCQNYQISRPAGTNSESKYTLHKTIETISAYLDKGIEAIGFVSPTHLSPYVKEIIERIHKLGHKPVTVYNTNAYDRVDILRNLEGYIDVYLPDLKYYNEIISCKYSDAYDYPEVAKKAVLEMYRQKGSTVVLDDNGRAVTGLIIRHLVLPGQGKDSIDILKWIAAELSPSVSISLMSQYYPTVNVITHPELGRTLYKEEYNEVIEAMEEMGFHKGWIQHPDSSQTYKPDFRYQQPFEISMEKRYQS
jgi:putative pyruvate formate lyase activating enzyme